MNRTGTGVDKASLTDFRSAAASSNLVRRLRQWMLADAAGMARDATCEPLERREMLVADFGAGLLPLRPGDGLPFEGLGTSVALSSNRVFGGAPFDGTDYGVDSGSVRIADLDNGQYVGLSVANGGGPFNRYGAAVATGFSIPLNAEIYAVGTPGADNGATDSGFVYLRHAGDSTVVGSFVHPEPSVRANYGAAVALNDHFLLAGAPGSEHQGINSGEAVLYNTITGQTTMLQPPDPARYMQFGGSVAIAFSATLGFDVAYVGAPNAPYGGFGSGSVYIFNAATGALLSRIDAPDASSGEYFGAALAASGDYAIIGAPADEYKGAAYVYHLPTGTFTKITPAQRQAAERFGQSVAMEGDYAVIGAPDRDFAAGAAFMYSVSAGQIVRQFASPNPTPYNNFGSAVAIRGAAIAIGEKGDQNESGTVHFSTRPTLNIELIDSGGQSLGQAAGVQEGNVARFRITRSSLLNRPLRAYYTSTGTAEAADFNGAGLVNGYVDFAQGQTTTILEVPLLSDARWDGEQRVRPDTVTISLDTNPSVAGQQGNPTGDLMRTENGGWIERPGGTGAQVGYVVSGFQWTATATILDETADPGFGAGDAVRHELSYRSYNNQIGWSVAAFERTLVTGAPYSSIGASSAGRVLL
ncbi:MAG: hypothetical protein PSX37_12090, partial [bacterium]|nr:hypothetical protein [bacterium]